MGRALAMGCNPTVDQGRRSANVSAGYVQISASVEWWYGLVCKFADGQSRAKSMKPRSTSVLMSLT